MLIHESMFVLQKIIVDGSDVDALEHYCVSDNFGSYKLLLQLWVFYEIIKLVLSKLRHARIVEERIFLFKLLTVLCRVVTQLLREISDLHLLSVVDRRISVRRSV